MHYRNAARQLDVGKVGDADYPQAPQADRLDYRYQLAYAGVSPEAVVQFKSVKD
ncbi:MAG: hypothetical protein BWY80_00764 [Firmicutes bacterium ADurb.Bin456]|nr:MAG: hypothetical protein BWY80_00764 [Firmicutes bacterium ADurb.Bin456]